MGRQPKKTDVDEVNGAVIIEEGVAEHPVPEIDGEKEEKEESKEEKTPEVEKVSERIDGILKLYPQYDEMWITDRGFVHPVGASEYLLKNAKLYKNKYYKQ